MIMSDIPNYVYQREIFRTVKLCDEMINEGATYLETYRHLLLKRLLAYQLATLDRS